MIRPTRRSLPKQFRFEQPKSPPVVVNLQGGQVTSDAGLSLIAEIDRKLQITSQFTQCFQDYRKSNRIYYTVESLITQRIYGLVMGYEDKNYHEELRHAPMFALALGKRIGLENEPVTLAGKSTLNRLEHCPEDVEQGADEFEQKLSTVVSFLETVFKADEKLPCCCF
ncbi:transposase [Nostoc sp.]|uniref:transposase n=1 Tax=Nostoc sp. TaxID=1180 RepID=UPI002FEE9253